MYTTSLLGQAAVGAAASLAGLHAQLTALTFGCALLSEAEQLRANHHIHECENVERLTRWLVNTRRELERRAMRQELVAASGTHVSALAIQTGGIHDETCSAPVRYATSEQKEQIIHALNASHITQPQLTRASLLLNSLTITAASLLLHLTLPPPFFDRPATKRELRDAADFSWGLTYADLVRC